jgi:hypothetical protein
MATFTIDLTTTTFYPSSAIGKTHLMNAKHAERIIAARNSKPEFTGDRCQQPASRPMRQVC